MGLVVKVNLKDGEKVKKFLVEKDLLGKDYQVLREGKFLFFPVKEKSKLLKKYKILEKRLRKIKKDKTIAEWLKGKLTSEELGMLPRTFEELGDILVLELEKDLEKKKKVIGEAYLKKYRQIKTVLKKKMEHSGEFRLRKLEWLAGVRKRETIYKENGISLKINLEKVYFSSKSANERLRIARLVKNGEEVLVMFSGGAPFPLVIGKNSKVKEVIGVELNPEGHKLAEENVKLNRLWGRVKLFKEIKDFDEIFEKVEWSKYFEVEWKEIFYVIKKMPVKTDYQLEWKEADEKGRLEIFKIHTKKMKLNKSIDLKKIIKSMEDFSGAEIRAVATEAGYFAIRENRSIIKKQDIIEAIKKIQNKHEEDEDLSFFG